MKRIIPDLMRWIIYSITITVTPHERHGEWEHQPHRFFPRHSLANNTQNSLSLQGRDMSTMALQINGNLNAGSTAWPVNNKWNLKDPHYWDILVRIFRLTLLGSSNCSTSFQNIMVQYIHPLGRYPSFSMKHNLDIMHKHYIFSFNHFVFNIAPEYTEWRLI